MKNYYTQFNLKKGSSQNRLILKLGRKINMVPKGQPLPKNLVVAFRIFLNPTLKKYYDHCLKNPKKYKRLADLLESKEQRFIAELENDRFPKEIFKTSTFWKLAWSDYLMVVLSMDFFHFGLGTSIKDEDIEPIPYRYIHVMGIVKFGAIYGFPLAMLTINTNFIYLILAIFTLRSVLKYPKVKADYYRTIIGKNQSEFGLDYKI